MNNTDIKNHFLKKPIFSIEESIQILESYSISSYPETFTLTAILKPSNKIKKQKKVNISDTIKLPYPLIKNYNIIAFVNKDDLEGLKLEFKKYTTIKVESLDYIEKIIKNPDLILLSNYDYCISSISMLTSLKKIESLLLKKKIMPNKKTNTLTNNPSQKINELIKKFTNYKSDRFNCIHLSIGDTKYSLEQIKENINTVASSILKHKLNASQKEQFNYKFYINSTMGPSLPINI